MTRARHRVLICGGGCGGIASAWALSRTPELRARFDVRLIQSGWRLGGKGATGRDPERGQAVLEHGLHLWLGFYDQAFALIRDLYESWAEAPTHGPLAGLDTAFTPLYELSLLGESAAGERRRWQLRFPELPGRPWDAPDAHRSHDTPRALLRWARALPTAIVECEPGGRAVALGLAATIARGLAHERARWGEGAWARMDALDLRAWLAEHGADEDQLRAPPIAGLYDLGFAYPEGHPGPRQGQAAAGTALRVLLRIFGDYRGAPFWRMAAGMGDTIFTPAWDVLHARGVRIDLFHHLAHIGLGPDAQRIERVEVQRQAELAPGRAHYDPFVRVGALRCWPKHPRRDQLSALAPRELDADTSAELERLQLRAGEDFDSLVLAIPAAGHPHFAGELIAANRRYGAMIEHNHSVATIAGQWWLGHSYDQLGFGGTAGVVTGLPGAIRTWADMSEVLDTERWPTRPTSLAYWCSVAPPTIAAMTEREPAHAKARAWIDEWARAQLPALWPGARTLDGAFDEGVIQARYARANVARWERYVLSLPGTTRHRLAPDESGFANLYLAGDWTLNAINGGSVEGAVSSGVAAARAILAREL